MSYLDPVINPTEDEFNAWLSTQTLRGNTNSRRLSDLLKQEQLAAMQADNAMGGDPGVPFAAPQEQRLNTIRSSSGRTIDLGYAAPGGSGVAPDGRRVKSDPWVDGPRVLSRKQLADGTIEVIKEAPALDGFGRQSSKIVREIETPDYLNPAKMKQLEYQTKQAELQKKLAEANEDMAGATAGRPSQKYLEKKYGKAGPGFRLTESGEAEPIPGGPADQKAQMKAAGATDVDIAIGTLRDAYNRLETGGGITSTEKGPLDNLGASISASGIGQVAGRAFGTSNQSARNDIAMSRPALLAALMKATGMSAKQMDSNVELKLWLTTATDPTLDVESNRRALDNIEMKYLGGNKATPATPDATPSKPKANLSLQDRQAIDWAMKNRGDPRAQKIMQKLGVQ